MTSIDREKLKRLEKRVELNYKITRLYALYLERFPEIITKEMIDTLCDDGQIDKKSAIVALLCEIFGIDAEKSSEDRQLIREYLTPSVRILNAEKYRNNSYYKNINIPSIKDGAWEFKFESYPAYRGVICHDMMLYPDMKEIPPLGFFCEDFSFPAVLENGNEWMTLTPVDLDTCEDAIEQAHGKVITFGLGLGYYAYMVSEKENVDSVTVVEKSAEVIRLFNKHILPQFPNKNKIKIINADAFKYAEAQMPGECYDVAFVDTWRDASDGEPMYVKMKKLEQLSPDTKFLYWIENFLISRHRAIRYDNLCKAVENGEDTAPISYENFLKALDEIE